MPSTPASLRGQVALVTGAGSGIGAAIARSLLAHGATVCLVGRNRSALEAITATAGAGGGATDVMPCDLGEDAEILRLRDEIAQRHGRLDVLVHNAGTLSLGPIESAPVADFDRQYRINVRGPYLLTQALLPLVREATGQVVFINSSIATGAKEQLGAYAATKHALRALADTLRMEVNPAGVRVLSIYPGNTATAMQQSVQEFTGKRLAPEHLLQPDEVARTVLHALLLPRSAEITDIHIRPSRKPSA